MANADKKALTGRDKRRKYASIAVSIVLAFCLWIYASSTDNRNSSRTYRVPVEFLNTSVLESKGLILADQGDTFVSVRIEGRRTTLSAVKEEDIVATVDVSSLEEGESYEEVYVHAPSSVNVTNIDPSQIRLTVEQKVTEERDVIVSFSGSTVDDEEAVCTDLSTEIVSISGAESAVSRVSYLSATIDTAKLSGEERTFVATLVPMDSNGNKVDNVTVAFNNVSVNACLYKVKTVKLNVETVGTLPDSLELASVEAPEKVTLAGPETELESITEVSTDAIDLSEISASTEVELTVDVPGNVRLASSQQTPVAVITVRKITTRSMTFAAEDITVNGLPDGMTAEFSEESVTIEIRGTDTSTEALSSEDFTLSVDCSSLTEGTGTVALNVELSDRAQEAEVTVNPVELSITLTAAAAVE